MLHDDCSLKSPRTVDFKTTESTQGLEVEHVHVANDPTNMGLQVVCATASSAPSRGSLKKIHAARQSGGLTPVVVLASNSSQGWVFGPNPESPVLELSKDQAHRLLQEALNEPTFFSQTQRLAQLRNSLRTADDLGVANAGLFANHYLKTGIANRNDWASHQTTGHKLWKFRGKDLIHELGFTESRASADAILLSSSTTNHRRAVAILLNEDEQFDAHSLRFNLTPIAYGLSVAAKNDVPWLMVLRGSQIRLYPAKDGVGVGQRSQAETYFELDLAVIPDEQIGLLDLVFSAAALEEGGSVDDILKASSRFAADLGARLRSRIYENVVPELARGVAAQLPELGLDYTPENLNLAYRLTLRILFRLLFQAYAEDKGLLPYERNERFTANALKTLVIRDLIPNGENKFDANSTALWDDLAQVWKVIDGGDSEWKIPAYNGGLFGRDPEIHGEGALIARMTLPNNVLGPALKSMLVDTTSEDVLGPVDFGSLSVREFGTIYEGLLESSLSLADSDLTLDAGGAWVPAGEDDTVVAAKNSPYFHNSSGERKATGSYFTPSIIVEHLLDRALEPALDEHLAKVKALLDEGKEAAAADLFFDFRVADLAMGSAHFLVAAVDRIETAFRNFLVDNPIPRVRAELKRLGDAAREALGSDAEFVGDIDDALLLRRQVARRCIYGLDINQMAVELARLALWIHTFVPGLPMSSLDHGLVCANSLTGIGSVEEALSSLDPKKKKDEQSLFGAWIESSLEEPARLLREAATADEATKQEINAAQTLAAAAKLAAEPTRRIFEVALAARLGVVTLDTVFDADQITIVSNSPDVVRAVLAVQPGHLPYLFPEVFIREQPGFDVVLGNPPWEELTVEANKFWKRFSLVPPSTKFTNEIVSELRASRPDLGLLYDREVEDTALLRKAVLAGPYPGMGVGDPDLYKGFAWRNLLSCRENGYLGLVLPYSAWSSKGSAEWRSKLLPLASIKLDLFRNEQAWLFENVAEGYRVTTLSARLDHGAELKVLGEFNGPEKFISGRNNDAQPLDVELLRAKDPEVCIPSVSSNADYKLWLHLLSFPGLSDGRQAQRGDFRCAPSRDLDATMDGLKGGVFTHDHDDHPVFNHLNVGNLVFEPSKGVFNYALLDSERSRQHEGRIRTRSRAASPYSLRNAHWSSRIETLPLSNPRIAFRDVVHSGNQRKAWFALAPSNTVLTNSAPTLVFDTDDLDVQAYVLGILASPVVDWFAHLRVNLHMNFFILYTLPVPTFVKSRLTDRLGELAARVAMSAPGDFGDWFKFGKPISEPIEQAAALAELAAISCLLFDLNEEHIRTIFDDRNSTRPPFVEVQQFIDFWRQDK
jgi:hypothetical protein